MSEREIPLSEDEFREIYSKVPRLCVDLMIQTEEGVLLSLRELESWKGQWHMPGGTVRYKESLVDAAKRLARDEVGLEVDVEKVVGHMEIDEEEQRGFGWTVSLVMLCQPTGGERRGSYQAQKLKFFQNIPNNTLPEQREFLRNFKGF